jgi:hypothetical protein
MYPLAPNSGRQRQLLDHCRNAVASISDLNRGGIQPRTLRAFIPLLAGNSQLTINLSGDNKVIPGSETLLASSRGFVGNLMGVGVAIVPIIGNKEMPGNMRMFSFPHPKVFDDGSTGGGGTSSASAGFGGGATTSATTSSELSCIRAFFNSLVTFKVNQHDVFEKVPTSRFAIINQYTESFIPEGVNMIDMQSTFILSGGNENKVIFDMGNADTSKIAGNGTTHKIYAVVTMEGYEAVTSNINVRDAALQAIKNYKK